MNKQEKFIAKSFDDEKIRKDLYTLMHLALEEESVGLCNCFYFSCICILPKINYDYFVFHKFLKFLPELQLTIKKHPLYIKVKANERESKYWFPEPTNFNRELRVSILRDTLKRIQ